MNRAKSTVIALPLVLTVFVGTPVHAFEEGDYRDGKFASNKEDREANSYFKLDGAIWGAYERNDHSANGSPDPSGPADEKTGFKVGRVYTNVRGGVKKGEWQGWSYRATLDIAPAGAEGDGCGSDSLCQKNNDYLVYLKYAYVDMPLFPGAFLRLGQQGAPVVGGSGSGSDSQDLWDHRYLDADGRAPWDALGLSSSADRGLSFFYRRDYFGLHVLLGNGESYHRNNAQTVIGSNDSLSELSAGSGDSYGQDIYAQVAVRPLGKNREHQVHLMLPFRQENAFGIDRSEVEYVSADISSPTAPRWTLLKGDKRAKRDQTYGLEAVYKREWNEVSSFTLGAGTVVKIDKRGEATKYTQTGGDLTLADTSCSKGRICVDEDRRGQARYVYAHFRAGRWGGFAAFAVGDGSTTKLSDRLQPAGGGEYWRNVLKKDAEDGQLGNLTLRESRALDFGLAQFRKSMLGVTWHAHERFRISFGVSRLAATDVQGVSRRENSLERVAPQSLAAGTLSSQLETQLALREPGLSGLTANDVIGRRSEDRQVFCRAQYLF